MRRILALDLSMKYLPGFLAGSVCAIRDGVNHMTVCWVVLIFDVSTPLKRHMPQYGV